MKTIKYDFLGREDMLEEIVKTVKNYLVKADKYLTKIAKTIEEQLKDPVKLPDMLLWLFFNHEVLEYKKALIKEPGYEEGSIKKRGEKGGWKIHLTVNPENHKRVYDWLKDDKNNRYACKYAHNRAFLKGKTFTVYIGSWDKMEEFADKLSSDLGEVLERPIKDALRDDLLVREKIATRYVGVFSSLDQGDFSYYGEAGIPYPEERSNKWHDTPKEWRESEGFEKDGYRHIDRKYIEKAYNMLKKDRGEFFTGKEDKLDIFIQEYVKGDSRQFYEF